MPEPTTTGWPRPGDVGYVVADWDTVEPMPPSVDQFARELRVFFVPDQDGTLYYVSPATMSYLGSPPKASAELFDPDEVKRTLAESLRESARKERDYGDQCRVLADTLERLAAESEGGEADV